ncbi:hypothetical protein NE236_13475 [Actinoallomurus purpureus]|uniref:hypothetical protein n=1 Tax=Actinoallomurus purpureus TaxID=478114 RepID=UPI00209346B5|nr:hypothetical protein [Actinoallomurus purpureus]MCO6005997.1 hypothetical protein [Actinoallomurus purpureus]
MSFKTAIGAPMAAIAAAGIVAFSTSPASAASHGSLLQQDASGGCFVSLYLNKSTKWAYAKVGMYSYDWTCKGFVKNNHGSKSWTAKSASDVWSGGVWRGKGYKVQACVYAYYKNKYKSWACTHWH